MKIPASIRDEFDSQVGIYDRLEERVKSLLEPSIPATWHYEGRVKKLESYAMKIETGRFDPADLSDFFACTVVVPTMAVTDDAEAIIKRLFEVVSRKPETNTLALSHAFDFPFDHIRVYVRLRVPAGLEPAPIYLRQFEVQIKTYLQHAWSIATHDLTYKTSELSWGKERVAAQVKATLEAAEVSIVQAEGLAKSGNRLLNREDLATASLVSVAITMQRHFTTPQMPEDLKRLATTVSATLAACGIEPHALERLLRRGKKAHGGSHPSNLSPFGVVLQYLVELSPSRLRTAMRRSSGPMILVPREITLPASFTGTPLPRARFIR